MAFDASDLEQWLEQSVPAQIWLAEQLGLPVSGYETLDQAWSRWAGASEPHLTPEIFGPSIAAYRDRVETWLQKPSDRPFVVAADSRDEALAFLACLFDEAGLVRFKDRAAIFTSPTTLRTLITSQVPFIPIVHSEEVERELGSAHRRLHCVVFRPRNAVDIEVDIALDLLSHEAFEKALKTMGVEETQIDRLARESGRSPTILRRRLSKNPVIRTPAWAGDDETAKLLVPIALVGAWHAESEADRNIVSSLADRTYEAVEDDVARLVRFDDSPVWSTGGYLGLASKIDAVFATSRMVTRTDLNRFFEAAENVLSEPDPALELPEETRWAAALYGKKREYSGALRNGICETLVILAVHGNDRFQRRLGIDVEGRVASLIHRLLAPLTPRKLLSQADDLPHFAEAAPDEFLNIVEADLQSDEPITRGLLKPIDSGTFGIPASRTGLLWALECLAWNPLYLARAAAILAQLSQFKIDDNLANKPGASLQAIFRSWMPQTSASVEQRVKTLQMIIKRFPRIGWGICVQQIRPGSKVGTYSYKPRWRSDASGAGQPASSEEVEAFNHKALDLLIDWTGHDENTLGDLVEIIESMSEEDEMKVWSLIDEWARDADEAEKAKLRERLRQFTLTRLGRRRNLSEATRNRAREAYDSLRPNDPVLRHGWLFGKHWVEESVDEVGEEVDYRKQEERIDRLRKEAIAEIWTEQAFNGIRKLAASSEAVATIGHYAATCVAGIESQVQFIKQCLSLQGELSDSAESCLRGFLFAMEDDSRLDLLQTVAESLPPQDCKRLFLAAPFQDSTWRLLDGYDDKFRRDYWQDVTPSWRRHSPAELNEVIDRLLDVRRPRAAFKAVQLTLESVETSRLHRLLRAVGTVDSEPTGEYRLERHYLSAALDSLDGRAGITRDEMAQLEFLFIQALDHSRHGIPNLESQLVESPEIFVQAVALVYKRSDEGEDPPEWRIENPEQREAIALAAHRLLEQIRMIPGTDENGQVDSVKLARWIAEARHLCQQHARSVIGDQLLGQLLAKAPRDETGAWPCRAVCDVMEDIASPELAKGFHVGVHNSRGVVSRGEGGDQERELAAKYRAWAEHLHFEFPYVGGVLENIARSYENEAEWHDSRATLAKRLRP